MSHSMSTFSICCGCVGYLYICELYVEEVVSGYYYC